MTEKFTPNARLKQLRLELRLSQRELAEKLGVPTSKINNIENEAQKIDLEFAIFLGKFFNVDWVWILTGEERETSCSIEDVDEDTQEVIKLYLRAREGDTEAGKFLEQRLFGLLAALKFKK